MKTLALALLVSAAALATSSARADTRFSFGISLGAPRYVTVPPTVVYAPAAPSGYWKEIVVKTWVPERVVIRHTRWGRPERVCEPGYFAYRTDRVWVAAEACAPSAPAYGYGHTHNRDHRDYRSGWGR